jgi:hypothetical protein
MQRRNVIEYVPSRHEGKSVGTLASVLEKVMRGLRWAGIGAIADLINVLWCRKSCAQLIPPGKAAS